MTRPRAIAPRTLLVSALTMLVASPALTDPPAQHRESAEISADALHAAALAWPSFEDHLRHLPPEDTHELDRYLLEPSNYRVFVDDRGDLFIVSFGPKPDPRIGERRGGGWGCLIDPAKWQVVDCLVMK